jgi:hypothetical protein
MNERSAGRSVARTRYAMSCSSIADVSPLILFNARVCLIHNFIELPPGVGETTVMQFLLRF